MDLMKNATLDDSISHSIQSALGKLLAGENINIIHNPKLETGQFNPKTRELALPTWVRISKEMYDFLLGHETSHAIWTPEDYGKEVEALAEKLGTKNIAVVASLTNIVEDIRIDKLMTRRFPGLRYDYATGYSQLWEKDFFGVKANPKSIEEYLLPDRLNIHFKTSTADIDVPFSEDEEKIVAQMKALYSWEDVLAGVETLFEEVKKDLAGIEAGRDDVTISFGEEGEDGEDGETFEVEIILPGPPPEEGEEGESPENGPDSESEGEDGENGESGDGESSEEDGESGKGKGEGEGEDGEDGKGEGEGEGEDGESGDGDAGDDEAGEKEKKSEENKSSNSSGGKIIIDLSDAGETQRNFDKRLKNELVEQSAQKIQYATVPEMLGADKVIVDFKEFWKTRQVVNQKKIEAFEQSIKDINKEAVYMAQQFERFKAAENYKNKTISKTGKLNMNKIHSYKYSEDIFLKKDIVHDAKNHGYIFFLDWSGSMTNDLTGTIQQLVRMTTFCHIVGIPFEVYSFYSGILDRRYGNYDTIWSKREGDLLLDKYTLVNILSSRMKRNVYDECVYNILYARRDINFSLGSTPLNETICTQNIAVEQFLESFSVENVNIVYLTDGQSNRTQLAYRDKETLYARIFDKGRAIIKKGNIARTALHGMQLTKALFEINKEELAMKYPEKNFNLVGMFLTTLRDRRATYVAAKPGTTGYDYFYSMNRKVFTQTAEFTWDDNVSAKSNINKRNKMQKQKRIFVDHYMKDMMKFEK